MNCPNCGSKFNDIVLKSHYGAPVKLMQCPSCGGVWCGSVELVSISPEQAENFEKINVSKLAEFTSIKKNLQCPQCGKSLTEFKDANFPSQVKILFCPQCKGFWLNRGELTEFKEWQEKKIESVHQEFLQKKDGELQNDLAGIMAANKPDDYAVLGNLGVFLNKPVDYTDAARGAQNDLLEIIFNILWEIARTLLCL